MHTLTRPSTHTHAHTYTPISNTDCFSTATVIRERDSVLRYTYIGCFVFGFVAETEWLRYVPHSEDTSSPRLIEPREITVVLFTEP